MGPLQQMPRKKKCGESNASISSSNSNGGATAQPVMSDNDRHSKLFEKENIKNTIIFSSKYNSKQLQ